MANKKETLFKNRIRPKLRELPNTWFFKTQERSVKGIPDIILCVHGKFIAIELKATDEDGDKLQNYNLDRINESFGLGFVCHPDNWDLIYKQIKLYAEGKRK